MRAGVDRLISSSAKSDIALKNALLTSCDCCAGGILTGA